MNTSRSLFGAVLTALCPLIVGVSLMQGMGEGAALPATDDPTSFAPVVIIFAAGAAVVIAGVLSRRKK